MTSDMDLENSGTRKNCMQLYRFATGRNDCNIENLFGQIQIKTGVIYTQVSLARGSSLLKAGQVKQIASGYSHS